MHGGITFLWVKAIVNCVRAHLLKTGFFFDHLYFVDKDKPWAGVTHNNFSLFRFMILFFC